MIRYFHLLHGAFTILASVPAIYLQQFWDTIMIETKTGAYRFHLDEDWFILDVNLLREALEITPADQAHQFVSPPSGDAIMDFVNQLGYPGEIHFVSRMAMNNLHQPWRAILSMINQCLTSKTSGFDTPRYPIIIYYLGRIHNIHQRSGSPLNLAEDDLSLGNLKFVPKDEIDEVFGMKIPKELITDNIGNAPYYNAYLEIVTKHNKKIGSEEGGKKKGKVQKVHKGKSPLKLIDEDEEVHHEPKPQEATRQLPVVEGKGKAIATDEQATQSLLDLQNPKKTNDTSANIVRDTPSPTDAETGAATDKTNSEGVIKILLIGEEQGEDMADKVNLEEKTAEIEEGQAGSDPDPGQSHVALAGPDLEPMHDDFIAPMYTQNLDTYTFGDQFFNDKPTKEEPDKANMEHEVESMVTIPIHQASSSVPPLSTPVIDLTPPKPAVHVALQASVRDRFRELPEADMKEILHQRMFESGSYKSLPKHVALHEALEAPMEHENRDEFLAEKDKSRKRRRDDQDPPPPPLDSDLSKKKRHDSDASGSIQPPAPQSSA
uniref:Histone deacetylase 14 n=1 Tax=Tanacetum cinerariifolium TaxID=118510 RepID=A0A699K2R3_TANCI|nr:histone deacetylase 14 [Tanacetum cinerariifolium]